MYLIMLQPVFTIDNLLCKVKNYIEKIHPKKFTFLDSSKNDYGRTLDVLHENEYCEALLLMMNSKFKPNTTILSGKYKM